MRLPCAASFREPAEASHSSPLAWLNFDACCATDQCRGSHTCTALTTQLLRGVPGYLRLAARGALRPLEPLKP